MDLYDFAANQWDLKFAIKWDRLFSNLSKFLKFRFSNLLDIK